MGSTFCYISGLRKHIGAVIDLAEEGAGESFNEEELKPMIPESGHLCFFGGLNSALAPLSLPPLRAC